MTCKILIAATVDWPSVARHAGGFAMCGAEVEALSPAGAPVTLSRHVRRRHLYRALNPLGSLHKAIAAAQPGLIVPCDDRATALLLKLHAATRDLMVAQLIATSLGAPNAYPGMIARNAFMQTAKGLGIRVPETYAAGSEAALDAALDNLGLPAVLKSDGSWGGEGVFVAKTRETAHAAWRRFTNPPSRLRNLARGLRRRDAHYLADVFAELSRVSVSVQKFIAGKPAASAFAAWRGDVVANVYYDVLAADAAIGPPNVVRRCNCPEIDTATRRIAKHFGLSGLHGMDFIRDAGGHVHLLEINPRATQGGVLAFGEGHDLAAGLSACASATAITPRPAITRDTVAFFPREWQRDPGSAWLRQAHHDVPWDDPAVICAALGLKGRRANAPQIPASLLRTRETAGHA